MTPLPGPRDCHASEHPVWMLSPFKYLGTGETDRERTHCSVNCGCSSELMCGSFHFLVVSKFSTMSIDTTSKIIEKVTIKVK